MFLRDIGERGNWELDNRQYGFWAGQPERIPWIRQQSFRDIQQFIRSYVEYFRRVNVLRPGLRWPGYNVRVAWSWYGWDWRRCWRRWRWWS